MDLTAVLIANMLGAGIAGISVLCSRIRLSNKNSEDLMLLVMIIISMSSCLIHSIAAVAMQHPSIVARWVAVFAMTFTNVASITVVFMWNYFLELHLFKNQNRTLKRMRKLVVPVFLIYLMYIVNLFWRFMFTVDAEGYTRFPLGTVCDVVAGGYLLFSLLTYLRFRLGNSRMILFPVLVFIVPAAIGFIGHIFFTEISLLWPGIAVGISGVSMSVQNEQAFTDKLTGLFNRAYLDYVFTSRRFRNQNGFGGIMIDVNSFKAINDNYGHSEGDDALKIVAGVLQIETRKRRGFAVRYAGDEFILILNTDKEQDLLDLTESVKRRLESFNDSYRKPYRLSLSFGCSMYNPSEETTDQFLRTLDVRMYRFKQEYYRTHDRRNRR